MIIDKKTGKEVLKKLPKKDLLGDILKIAGKKIEVSDDGEYIEVFEENATEQEKAQIRGLLDETS